MQQMVSNSMCTYVYMRMLRQQQNAAERNLSRIGFYVTKPSQIQIRTLIALCLWIPKWAQWPLNYQRLFIFGGSKSEFW